MDNSSEGDPYLSPLLFLPILAQANTALSNPALPIQLPLFSAPSNWLLLAAACSLMVAALLRSARTAVFSLNDTDQVRLGKQSRLAQRIKQYLNLTDSFALTVRWAADVLYLITGIALFIYGQSLWGYEGTNSAIIALLSVATTWIAAFGLEFVLSSFAVHHPLWFVQLMAVLLDIVYTILSPFAKWWRNRYKLAPTPPPMPDNDVYNHAPTPPDPTLDTDHHHPEPTEPTNYMAKGMSKFKHLSVKQIMCNRVDIYAIDIQTNFKTLCQQVIEWGYSRLPIYDEDLDHIVGVLYTKELLRSLTEDEQFEWQSLVKPPYFVPQNKKVNDLLKEMQRSRVHLAIAVDEFGSTSGLITLEDILEEIVGDIRDEYDEDDMSFRRLDRYQYVFNGRTTLSDMCRVMHLPPDLFDQVRGEAESLGGLLIEIAGKFPDENDTVTYKHFFFTVLTRRSNRIDEVKVTLLPEV